MLRFKIYLIKFSMVTVPILVVLLFLRLFLPAVAKEYKGTKFGEDGKVYASKNFDIYAKKLPYSPQEVGIIAEDFFHALVNSNYGKKMGIRNLEQRATIFFFSNRQEFDEYQQKFRREIPHNAAVYSPTNARISLYWTNSANVKKTLYHELTHMAVDIGLGVQTPDWSPWFNEGVAMYFERFQVQDQKLKPGPIDMRIVSKIGEAWKNKKYIPIDQLLRASSKSFTEKDNSLYYYESYLLIYFLFHREKGIYQNKFYEYYEEERKPGYSYASSFWSIMDEDPQEFEKQFIKYLNFR